MYRLNHRKFAILVAAALLAGVLLVACTATPAPAPSPTQDLIATIVQQTLAARPTEMEATPIPTEAPAPSSTPTLEPTPTITMTLTPQPSPTSPPTATSIASTALPSGVDPRDQLGAPTLRDTMSTSQYWPTGDDDFTSATFRDERMYVTALTDTDGWRLATLPSLEDFYAEVSGAFEDCSGTDHFGLIVRIPERNPADRGYLFGISCDGRYSFSEWDGSIEPRGQWTTHLNWTEHSAIIPGAGQTNRVGVMATGNLFELYVNGVKVAELQDDSFPEGFLGIYVGSDETDQLTIRVTEFSYWNR
jgi:hypothetical protein